MNQQECDRKKKHYLGIMTVLFILMAIAIAILYNTEADGNMLARLAALVMMVGPLALIYSIAAYFQCKPTKKSSISDYPIKRVSTGAESDSEETEEKNGKQ